MIAILILCAARGSFNVTDYGAAGNGKTLDSPAIDRAITAAAAAGGGTVEVPAGNYLCTTVHLRSNVTLDIQSGATVIAADGPYDEPEPNAADAYQDFGHTHWHNALLVGDGLENIALTGQGKIWGRGLERDVTKKPLTGDKSISLVRCRNVLIRDLTIQHGGWFAILATGVDNLTIDSLKIDTNRDGMDIDCCRHVTVSNCFVNSPTDDGICLKSSYALGESRATEDVTVTNCQVSGYEEGSFLDGSYRVRPGNPTGRIKLGTESNGGFRNVAISNCVFDHCRGLNLATVDGGDLEDVSIQNVVMRNIGNSPLFLRLGARLRGPKGTQPGVFRRVSISGLHVYGAAAPILISGIPGHPIEDVTLRDVTVVGAGDGTSEDGKIVVPEAPDGYPAPEAFGRLPASAMYIRHVRRLAIDGATFTSQKKDRRPPVAQVDTQEVRLRNVTTR